MYLLLAALLLLCLADMPHGYYTLVRFAAMIIFGCMAFNSYKDEKMPQCVFWGSLALLFQPYFFELELGRDIWEMVDIIVAIVLVVQWYKIRKNHLT